MNVLLCDFKKVNDNIYKNSSTRIIKRLSHVPDIIDLSKYVREIKVCYPANDEYVTRNIISNTYNDLSSLYQDISNIIISELHQTTETTNKESLLKRLILLSDFMDIIKFKMDLFPNDDDIIIIIK